MYLGTYVHRQWHPNTQDSYIVYIVCEGRRQLILLPHHLSLLSEVLGNGSEDGVCPVILQLHSIRFTHSESHGRSYSLQCLDEVLRVCARVRACACACACACVRVHVLTFRFLPALPTYSRDNRNVYVLRTVLCTIL